MLHRTLSDERLQIDALDGLRGLAALIVVFSHTSNAGMFFLPWLNLRGIGKSGVYLFFLLSAFLLTLYFLRKGREVFSLAVMSHYWQRRFFRIYPLYSLYLLGAVCSTWLAAQWLQDSRFALPFPLDWSGLLQHLLLQEGRSVTWSIAVEFKFYLLLPLLAWLAMRLMAYGLWPVWALFAALLLFSQWISPQSQSVPNDPSLLPYLPIFLIGVLSAVLHEQLSQQPTLRQRCLPALKVLGFIGLGGVVLMIPELFSLLSGKPVEGGYFHQQFILYSVLWACVLLSATNVPGIIQRIFSLSMLRFYGALSFSLYLFHIIFIKLIRMLELSSALAAWSVLLLSSIAAYISFTLLEKPLSQYKFKGSAKKA